MSPRAFVNALAAIDLESVFNPYRQRCSSHDMADGPAVRRRNLRSYLEAIQNLGTDTIWMGRDLGYRGGRRTGLALTDEYHLPHLGAVYPGAGCAKATKGPAVAERTAAEVWSVLLRLKRPPLLWNVFPFHPHESGAEFTNRKFAARELAHVSDLNQELISWLGIRRIVCIGQDAASYAEAFGCEIECVRHPSYGGVTDFRDGMRRLYRNELRSADRQRKLF